MFLRPSEIVQQFDIHDGDFIVDCGAGTGTFTMLMAERVGRSGHVVALEVQKDLVDTIVREAHDRNLTTISALGVDLERPQGVPLRDGVADMALLSNVLFQVADKKTFLAECVRLVRTGGQVVIIEWCDAFGGIGPRPDYVIPEEAIHTLADEAGLLYHRSLELGDYQYGVMFHKL